MVYVVCVGYEEGGDAEAGFDFCDWEEGDLGCEEGFQAFYCFWDLVLGFMVVC